MVLGLSDRIPEEDETKSEGKRDSDSKEEANVKYTRSELKSKLWKVVGEGHSDSLKGLLEEVKHFDDLEVILNEENPEVDEDGNNLLLYCIKEGCDSGHTWGRHFHKCAEILIEHNVNINYHNKAGHTPLYEAVFYKNTSYVSLLLEHGAESDRFDQDGIDPLHLAIHLGYKDCFNLLVKDEDKEIYDRKDGKGNPPLVAAVQNGHLELCHLLLDHGCDVNAHDRKLQRTALHYAVIAKRFDIFELLLKYHPDLEHSDHKGRTILHRVCAINEAKYLKKLFHCGIKISTDLMEQETDDGLTPVIVACQNGNAEQLKELLENGASVTTTDKTGKNALHYCADNLETQCAEMLLMRDESLLQVQDEQGFTPLHMAVIGGNVPLLKLLVRKGADVNILDADGHTPAHWATVCTHLEILDVLIENDAKLSKCDSHNAYPIHYAAQMNGKDNGHSDIKIGEKVLKKLIDSGIPCDVLDKDRRQPLLWAASAGNSESCRLLVTAGADVNSVDKDGLTALHCAASRGHAECVEKLKKLGADVNIADTNGCTALFYAITLGNKECTRLLLKYGTDPNHKDSRGRTPTHCAAIKGCLETVKMLDKSKADLWFPSFRGDCPIHEAAQGGHCDVVKYLLKWKNDPEAVNIANDAGRTCLHIAAIVNNLPLCKLLLDSNAERNALMKNKSSSTKDEQKEDKVYTPYDAAIIKGNNEIAEYIKSKGGNTGGDIDNILIAKGKKPDRGKSGRSRKSELESTPEETEEPEDNKKAEEDTEKEKLEEEKKKKEAEKLKKKEKEEKEREKEKFVIIPKSAQKKEKGEADQKESEKEKGKDGKGEKKDLTDEELKELQNKIKEGQGGADERDINRKPIPVVETKDGKQKKEKKTSKADSDELEEAKRKIKEAEGEADDRDKKQKEKNQKEAAPDKEIDREKSEGKSTKQTDQTDEELKALQAKIKDGQGGADDRDKKQKQKTTDKKAEKDKKTVEKERKSAEKSKPELTDKELAITAAVIIAAESEEKEKKTKEKADKEVKKKEKDQEGIDIPAPSGSPDLRDPKAKQKDKAGKSKEGDKQKEKDKAGKSKEGDKQKVKSKDIDDKKLKEDNKKVRSNDEDKKLREDKKVKSQTEQDQKSRSKEEEGKTDKTDELDSKSRSKEEEGKTDKSTDELDSKDKTKTITEVPKDRDTETPQSSAPLSVLRESPYKEKRLRDRSNSSDRGEFEFPEGAPENEEAALKRAEQHRKTSVRSRSNSSDRESEDRLVERKFSKVANDGVIQPGLLAENRKGRRLDERDSPSFDSEDEFVDDPYFGHRIKYGSHRVGRKQPDNREKVLREKQLNKKRQGMSRSSQRMPSRHGGSVAKMLPLGYSRLETPQRPIVRKSNSVQESVRRYQSERTFVRQLHQLKRAQIYTGPMHDIVLFSKMMNVYKNSSGDDSQFDLESHALDDWDSYLQDQLRFVSHYYEDDRTGLRDTAKEYHHQLEKSATDAKRTVDTRIDQIIKQNEKQEEIERGEQDQLDKKITTLAEKTDSALESIRQKADETIHSARNLNSSLEEDFRRERQERLRNSKYVSKKEKQWLLEQEAMDDRQSKMDAHDKERKDKHKEWMRKKDEEMRKKLMKVYGPTPVFDPIVSRKGASQKTSTPKPLMNSSRASSRPKSMISSISGSKSRPVDHELEVHMTEFGMRRVKTEYNDHSFAKMSTPPPHSARSHIRPSKVLPANWTPKYDGVNLRPRAGLVFVEPAIYDQVLQEEKMIRNGSTRNSTRNLTLETDRNLLETVES